MIIFWIILLIIIFLIGASFCLALVHQSPYEKRKEDEEQEKAVKKA